MQGYWTMSCLGLRLSLLYSRAANPSNSVSYRRTSFLCQYPSPSRRWLVMPRNANSPETEQLATLGNSLPHAKYPASSLIDMTPFLRTHTLYQKSYSEPVLCPSEVIMVASLSLRDDGETEGSCIFLSWLWLSKSSFCLRKPIPTSILWHCEEIKNRLPSATKQNWNYTSKSTWNSCVE